MSKEPKTPRLGHSPILMVRVDGYDQISAPGHFTWKIKDGKRSLVVALPCGSKRGWVLSQWTIDHKNHCDAQWSWDKNEDKPTLRPSLHAVGLWHGWVRDGKLVEA